MKIAFYAPLKPPDHPVPSGDRELARLFMRALAEAGFDVQLMSRFRSFDGAGDRLRQQRLAAIGERLAARLLDRLRQQPVSERPVLWFSYHVYHKAPDWIGPAVAGGLGIPYLIAEASHARKQEYGPWATGFRQARAAIAAARGVVNVNSTDLPGLREVIGPRTALLELPPFSDWRADRRPRRTCRAEAARRLGIDAGPPWLIAVAMMRSGDKARSYRLLGDALARCTDLDWRLLVVGDGAERTAVEADFRRRLDGRCHFTGRLDAAHLAPLLRAADIFVWPAINEAFGMALLEAQLSAVPVVAGASRGVADIVGHDRTGLLSAVGDAAALAADIRALVGDRHRRRRLAQGAARRAAAHSIGTAAARLSAFIHDVSAP